MKLNLSQPEHLQIFPTSLAKWDVCASLRLRVRERPKKIFSFISVTLKIIRTRSSIFYDMKNINSFNRKLSVCNFSQYIYVIFILLIFIVVFFNFFCFSRFDRQNQFLFSDNSFLERLASYWLLTVNVTSYFQ